MKKAFTFRRVVAVTLLALFTAAPALLTTALVQAAESPVAGPKAELQRLTAEVTSNDPERVKAAVPQLWALLHQCKKNTVLVHIVDDCVLQLIRAKAYEGIDEIIQEYAVAYPAGCDRLLKARVTALLGLGKKEEALAAAKTYFNYVPLGRTMEAINFLSQTLVVARPDDKDIVRRFKQEQLAGSQTQPAAKQTVLDSIKIDGQVFQKAADQINLDGSGSYARKGNLLLLAGNGKEARDVFEEALALADSKQLGQAIGNVARAIRTEHGCIGPANAYILEQRQNPE